SESTSASSDRPRRQSPSVQEKVAWKIANGSLRRSPEQSSSANRSSATSNLLGPYRQVAGNASRFEGPVVGAGRWHNRKVSAPRRAQSRDGTTRIASAVGTQTPGHVGGGLERPRRSAGQLACTCCDRNSCTGPQTCPGPECMVEERSYGCRGF